MVPAGRPRLLHGLGQQDASCDIRSEEICDGTRGQLDRGDMFDEEMYELHRVYRGMGPQWTGIEWLCPQRHGIEAGSRS